MNGQRIEKLIKERKKAMRNEETKGYAGKECGWYEERK